MNFLNTMVFKGLFCGIINRILTTKKMKNISSPKKKKEKKKEKEKVQNRNNKEQDERKEKTNHSLSKNNDFSIIL